VLDATLEAIVARLTAADGGADLDERTGEFSDGDGCYETRIRFFLDDYLCGWRGGAAGRALAMDLEEEEREVARACLIATRGLFRVLDAELESNGIRVLDELRGARFRLAPEGAAARLQPGDVFDGRLLVVSNQTQLAPGLIFHPAETHAPLGELLDQLRAEDEHPAGEVLDGLLRMRMRLERFTSIRPRHLYRLEALFDRDILSAGWARKSAATG
jgi:hypothetical protein